jgi:ABC-type sugar transport system substrate-binding protein
MKKKLFVTAVVLIAIVLIAFPLVGAERAKKQYTIGVVIPYEIGWFTAFHNGFQLAADQANVKLVFQYNNYKADDELKAVQNLITMGVDAINVTSVSPAAAEYSCRLANEAKIPIQITESGIAEGKGKPFADVDFNWFEIYRTVARGLRKDVKGDLSVVWVQGFAGTPPVMQGIEGFKDEITKLKGIKLATDVQYGNYATEVTLPLMKSVIESGVKFNVAIGACQEITEGIITAVKEEKVDRKSVTIVTVNGGPMDIENFKDGDLDYCLSLSPGLHGMICASNIIAYLDNKTYQKKSYSPIVWCGKSDWQQKLIPWGMDQSWTPVVDEFVRTGKYKPELRGK